MITQAEALNRAARQFREYESHHQQQADAIEPARGHNFSAVGKAIDAKTDRETKAARNREMAEMCEAVVASRPYQVRVAMWMLDCFNPEIADDQVERGDRLLEETFELLQTMGYDFGRIAQVRDYVASRPVGEPAQEVGGVAVCLFALCNAIGVDVGAAAEAELTRISDPETMVRIRAKQAAKPKMSPLPQ